MQPVQARATAPPTPERKRLRAFVLIAALAVFGVLLFASNASAKHETAATCLPSGATETGVWFASLAEPAGAPQDEVDGVVSYQIPLCKINVVILSPAGVEAVYLTEAESELPFTYTARGCGGSANEAEAEPGHLCLFTANGPGSTEARWQNAHFRYMQEPDGVQSIASGTRGDRAVFVTTNFRETGPLGTVPAGGSYLVAGGPWAVTAP
jgi:hypothetical protein